MKINFTATDCCSDYCRWHCHYLANDLFRLLISNIDRKNGRSRKHLYSNSIN